ncbi:MAG: O-antigen ligase family protein [Methylotenera sp.]|nr:O-antigen ligase family protein [Methylotenera sp.]HPM50352.1 O-antigen ligase family protein [Methylotenera sp.]
MPENLRALVVILILAAFTFFFARKVTQPLISAEQFRCWRNAWLGVTLIVFLAGNFWVYIILTALLLLFLGKREANPFALFMVLLFAVPRFSDNIPGFGLVNFLFAVDYVTVLSLAILLPAFLRLRKQADTTPFLRYWPDKLLLAYLVLDVVLLMRDTTFTDAMRGGLANFTDVFLPYYVASRGIKNLQQLKEALVAFILAGMLAGAIAMFEYARFWLLYSELTNSMGIDWSMGSYLGRGDNLRALASLGQPIALGYIMVATLGCYFFLAKYIQNRFLRLLGWALILGGLFAPLSRGPWVGAAILVVFYIMISPRATKRMTYLALAILLVIPLLSSFPVGQKVINMLPFIGKTDTENVDYRVKLLDNAYIVFNRYPFFGSVKFNQELADLGMVQGEGIVDVVNSYLFEALEHGFVGLALYIAFFVMVLVSIYKSIKEVSDEDNEVDVLGRTLLAVLVATLVTIATVSSILIIPVVYWTFSGLGLSYSLIAKGYATQKQEANFLAYRLAFEAMPTVPAYRLSFSSLTKHRVVLDSRPIYRIAIKQAPRSLKKKNLTSVSKTNHKNNTTPTAVNMYSIARAIRPGITSRTTLLQPHGTTSTESRLENGDTATRNQLSTSEAKVTMISKIQVLNGSNTGRELFLDKVLTKLGKPGVQLALITKRQNGYFITHLEGNSSPFVNGAMIGEHSYLLKNQDVIDLAGIKVKFLSIASDS